MSCAADLVDECEGQLLDSNLNLHVECVGGGRIRHESDRKYIFVYGYSVVSTLSFCLQFILEVQLSSRSCMFFTSKKHVPVIWQHRTIDDLVILLYPQISRLYCQR